MAAQKHLRSSTLAVIIALTVCVARSEIISDLTVGSVDETRALEVKAEQFWGSILAAAEAAQMGEHAQLYADAEKVINELPGGHEYVKQALTDSLSHLRHADDLVLIEAVQSTKLASDELRKPIPGSNQAAFSFMSGGQMLSIFKDRLRRFASDGTYSERLVQLVEQRQTDIMPVLQGTVAITGDVLKDCHAASARSFDALKYDIYHKGNLRGASPTPENAKAVANRLVDAAGQTRHRFISFITETVSRIAKDAEGKHDNPAATVTKASIDLKFGDSSLKLGAKLTSGPLLNV